MAAVELPFCYRVLKSPSQRRARACRGRRVEEHAHSDDRRDTDGIRMDFCQFFPPPPWRFDRLYLLDRPCGLGPLTAGVPFAAVVLLAVGGLLYSIGVVFHLWQRL